VKITALQGKTLRNDNYFSKGQLTLDLDAIFSVNHSKCAIADIITTLSIYLYNFHEMQYHLKAQM
jgi:hypothetical protein